MTELCRFFLSVRGVIFEAFGVILGAFLAHLGSLLASFWRPGEAWGGLGAHFSKKVGPPDVWRDFMDALGRPWGPFGSQRGPLGLILAPLGLTFGVLGGNFCRLGAIFVILG